MNVTVGSPRKNLELQLESQPVAMDTLLLSNESEEKNTFEKIMTAFLGTLDQGRTYGREFC